MSKKGWWLNDGGTGSGHGSWVIFFDDNWSGSAWGTRGNWTATVSRKTPNRTLVVRPGRQFPNKEEAQAWCEQQFKEETSMRRPAKEEQLLRAVRGIQQLVEESLEEIELGN